MSTRIRLSATLLAGLILAAPAPSLAADPTPPPAPAAEAVTGESVHAEMLAAHEGDVMTFTPGEAPTGPAVIPTTSDGSIAAAGGITGLPNGLFREVLGYLPYWMLDADELATLDLSLVSTIAYFSVGAQANGTLAKGTATTPSTGWAGWTSSAMTGVINQAHTRGVKVVLTVTMMSWSGNATAMTTLLTSAANRSKLASEIAAAVKSRNADGLNLDFEPVPASLRSQYTQFVREMKAKLVASGARSYLSVATMAGAATWSTGYDVAALSASGAADALMVMAYDFSWSGSARAGGVAPISNPYILDVREALSDYLEVAPASKIIWGVPYYGREWSTDSSALNATTNDALTSVAGWYTFHRAEAAARGRKWDSVGKVPWYVFRDTANDTWVEGYYDDVQSLTAKYDLVNLNDLRGIGIWHLGMDGTRRELWNALDTNFQGPWFEDIVDSPFRADILWIANNGISAGCGVERFCPKSSVTREQMASFLARALHLPAPTRDWFTDDETTAHEGDINRLAEAGITGGCASGRFCPKASVTREQMASFLARAFDLPRAAADFFGDDNSSQHEGDINRVAQAGITGGCASNRYCPTSTVTREQMAAFLHRALT
jgi:spore germination protein YaaH